MKSAVFSFINQLILMSVFLITVSCAPGAKTKTAQIFVSGFTVAGGQGSVIYGSNGAQSFAEAIDSQSINVTIAPGLWRFVIVKWIGGTVLNGDVKCGISAPVFIANKAQAQVDINLNFSQCAEELIGVDESKKGGINGIQPAPLAFVPCLNQEAVMENDIHEYEYHCVAGSFQSYKLSVGSFNLSPSDGPFNYKNNGGDISGFHVCSTADADGGLPGFQTAITMPIFNALSSIKVPVVLQAFTSAGCTGSTPVVYNFNQGLSAGIENEAYPDFEDGYSYIFLHQTYCTADKINETNPVTFRNYTVNFDGFSYKVVCSETQFQDIQNNLSSNYFIGKDLDISSLTPIGTCTTSCLDNAGDTFFSGRIYGDNHTLSGFTQTKTCAGGTDSTGIFLGLSSPAKIENLIISNADITNNDCSASGVLAGFANGGINSTSQIYIEDVKIINSNLVVTAAVPISGVGFLVGQIKDYVNLRENQIEDADFSISGFANDVGGLIGSKISSSTVYSQISENLINSVSVTDSTSSKDNYGGLAGSAAFTNFHGNKVTDLDLNLKNKSYVGGLVGYVDSNVSLEKNLVEDSTISSIFTSIRFNASLGGLLGYSGSRIMRGNLVRGSNISATGTASVGDGQVGGLVGYLEFFDANHVTFSNNYVKATVQCEYHSCGGLIGKAKQGTVNSLLTIENSFFQGSVLGENSGGSVTANYVGGLIGTVFNTTTPTSIQILNSFSEASGLNKISGNSDVGGIIGNIASDNTVTVTLQDVASKGFSISTGNEANPSGGFIGKDARTIALTTFLNYVWNNNTFNRVSAKGLVGYQNGAVTLAGTSYFSSRNNTEYIGVPPVTPASFNASSMALGSRMVDIAGFAYPKFYDPLLNLGGVKVGSWHDPYLIESVADFNSINDTPWLMDGFFELKEDLDFSAITLSPSNNIIPIGSGAKPFRGVFLGNGHRLSNITISSCSFHALSDGVTAPAAASDGCGVFRNIGTKCYGAVGTGAGEIHGGTYPDNTESLFIENIDIDSATWDNVGALVGKVIDGDAQCVTPNPSVDDDLEQNGVEINNIKVTGSITGQGNVGGVIGSALIQNTSTEMINLENHADVNGTSTNVGGVLGYYYGGGTKFSLLRNFGEVSSTVNVGGVVGTFELDVNVGHESGRPSIDGLANFASVSGGTNVGGIVGTLSGADLQFCFSRDFNKFTSDILQPLIYASNTNAGGLVGYSANSIIESCYSRNRVAANLDTNEGGLAGGYAVDSDIKFSYFKNTSPNQPATLAIGPGDALTSIFVSSNPLTSSTYTGFDFETVWMIKEGSTLPYLKFEKLIISGED
jgi:hypothetical protein